MGPVNQKSAITQQSPANEGEPQANKTPPAACAGSKINPASCHPEHSEGSKTNPASCHPEQSEGSKINPASMIPANKGEGESPNSSSGAITPPRFKPRTTKYILNFLPPKRKSKKPPDSS
jgi:hypothetical protein